jgi:hypothetical protein
VILLTRRVKSARRIFDRSGEQMSDAAQNVINSLQRQRLELMIKLDALQTDAKRHAYHAVVHGSWKARQDFRDAVEAADQLSDEIAMTAMALAEAHARLQTRGRDVAEVLKELKFSGTAWQSPVGRGTAGWGRARQAKQS